MRIQLDLPEDNVHVIQDLMRKGEMTTYKELFNTAVGVYAWCIRQAESGRVIASLDEATMAYRELALPVFEMVRAAALVHSVDKPVEKDEQQVAIG